MLLPLAPFHPWLSSLTLQPAALPPPSSGGVGFEEPAPFSAPQPAANNQLAAFNPFGGLSMPPSLPDPNPAFGGPSQVSVKLEACLRARISWL